MKQHMQALQRANNVRLYRAGIKRKLRSYPTRTESRRAAAELMLIEDPALDGMRVHDLLASCTRTGKITANKIMSRAAIPEAKLIGYLTPRQRELLAAMLGARREAMAA